jgi:PAS domain S-box-containing protein
MDSPQSYSDLLHKLQQLETQLKEGSNAVNSTDDHSDSKLRIVVELEKEAILNQTPDGIIVSANNMAAEFTGYEREELLGMHLNKLFPEEELKREPFQFDKLLLGKSVSTERFFKKKDGTIVFIDMNTCLLPNNIFQTTIKDISEQKKTADLLKHNQIRLQSLYELIQREFGTEHELLEYALETAIKLTNSNIGFIHYVNPDQNTIEKGCWANDHNNSYTSYFNDIYPFDKNKVLATCVLEQKVIIDNNNIDQTNKAGYTDKHPHVERFICIPVVQKNKVVLVTGVANKEFAYDTSDIEQLQLYMQEIWKIILRLRSEYALKESEHMLKQQNEAFFAMNDELNKSNTHILEINRELKIAKDKAEESDNLKSSFLANMSHEIRTPLNAISGFSELLKDPEIEKETINQYVEIINANCIQLTSIIDDIIDVSRIESGQVVIKPITVNLNKVLESASQVFRANAITKGIDFNVTYGLKNEEADIETDDTRLKQILNNLLNNAFKFTEKGSISLGYSLKNKHIEFFIRDTGIGIAKEFHELIFERFRQIDIGNSRKFGGTGLGLTISRVLTELLGGRIRLESEIDKGSTFYFTIPYNNLNKLQVSSNKILNDSLDFNWKNKSILVAEDEEFNYFYVQEILSSTKVKIIRARNGLEAVKICQNNTDIDLILMDIKMPQMDGYEATRLIKEMLPNTPIIAQTAFAMSEDRTKAINAGCNNYIAKPINRQRLMNMIQDYFTENK